ncbi:unnamed protein product [Triticum turgidum subsp. durum]|uniref:Uncharacterized protein n=1 Tax=Triticum turgidum subsp. durum TaxID=4567 RepID=A0A9R1BS79_TRITD|nr:unnamed protein product [Triticum turgidum subsp. durum]
MGTPSMQKSWHKACGAIKDSTTVSLAKVNSGRDHLKDLDVAVVKATSHVERPPKDRHLSSEIASPLDRLPHTCDPSVRSDQSPAPPPRVSSSSSLQRSSAPGRARRSPTASTRSPGASPTPATGWWL